ncbi:hypothetical protein MZK47_14220 [Microbacterium aerolatum]|uniref:hypothetical protein n=1 Tax=Microbacterium aerolatum TaxID=153731 RepID=UPI0020016EAF|nr:hypothetical protein [Microbacterium aerolatum]MCK3770833.1 hypothetical protein [Microbacterium aerolatum]
MAETAGGWGNEPGGGELWRLIGDAFGRAAAADPPRPPDPEIYPHPIRVDGPAHSWIWDGDDPRIECAGCKELRDAHNGHVLRPGQA